MVSELVFWNSGDQKKRDGLRSEMNLVPVHLYLCRTHHLPGAAVLDVLLVHVWWVGIQTDSLTTNCLLHSFDGMYVVCFEIYIVKYPYISVQ